MNPIEIEEAVSQLALEPFDRGDFPFSFLRAFGNPETTIKRLRTGSTNQSDVGGVLQRNNIHIATCDAGEVEATLGLLRDSPKTATAKAKFILATDGDSLQAEDCTSGETVACDYADFPDHFDFFLPLAGITTVEQIRESSFDIRATSRLNKLYVELLKDNPDWAKAERRPDMNHFMARLIFCFFAEDTDIFVGEGLFTKTVEQMSARDSSDTHAVISEIFRSMDTKRADREAAGIPRYANQFPYVNGELFSGSTEVPRFTKIARSYLNHIGNLNWRKINPDIFGSMIQAVADDEERGALGMHYTSVPNILKVLNPLFLDDLRGKLEEAGDNGRKLLNLRNRMARIRVFDPACGSGNFLVIAYKQMREIEAEINRRRGEPDRRTDIPLTNFRGIELRDFPAEIARLALIIAEFQSDVLYRGQQEALAEFLPLDSENWIVCGNALEIDWLAICPPSGGSVRLHANDLFRTPLKQSEIDFENEGGEVFVCGNPPYAGSSKQTKKQKYEIERIFKNTNVKYKNLDYISGWFALSEIYCRQSGGSCALVTTNSICQGEQVYLLWPHLLSAGSEIFFAQAPFKWKNLASNNAGVTCVVVGIRAAQPGSKYIYFEETKREVSRINAYLIEADDIFIPRHGDSISGLPKMLKGNQPTDGGCLILSASEQRAATVQHPETQPFIRPLYGSKELIDGVRRFCLWIEPEDAEKANSIPFISDRLDGVRRARLQSPAESTRKRAGDSFRFIQIQDYGKKAVVIPEISSEKRMYIPCGIIDANSIATNKLFAVYGAPLFVFAICSSRMHRIWAETVCGKLEERISYSNVLGYNTFPIGNISHTGKLDLMKSAQDILIAREANFPAALSDLYDPDNMPEELRRAHDKNDEVLERIYIGRRFRNDTERLEKLFDLYTKMTTKGKAA